MTGSDANLSHLLTARLAVVKPVSAEAVGEHFKLVLYVAHGAHGAFDPAFDANIWPLQTWPLARC